MIVDPLISSFEMLSKVIGFHKIQGRNECASQLIINLTGYGRIRLRAYTQNYP